MAKKYIDADELLNEVLGTMFSMSMCLSEQAWRGMKHAQQIFARMIETAPAADVVEVRHGRWLSMASDKVIAMEDDGCPVDSCRCSECGDWLTSSDEYAVRGRYCPNCGAKMEVDGE